MRVSVGGKLIIDGIDCTVPPGSLAALIGPNGAGKSTLLRALAAVEKPQSGSVSFDGSELYGMPRRERAKLAAFVEQDAATELSLTVEAVVALGRMPHLSLWQAPDDASRTAVTDALDAVGMREFAGRDVTTLSGGERQRVLLAKALAQQARLLLLDEPTNHLDIRAQLSTLALLRSVASTGVTVLAALHDLGLAAAWCDSVIVVADGRVVAAGETAATLTPELIRDVYGVRATVFTDPASGRPVIGFGEL
ncbi:ATP-binding cassette domain-containing protein [Glaciihabitans arcticus]|uniref:ATP-binding cassette domain-containing protein n=1 Tax=Glaciihabitans arcticus TaxID=2668039 RepID=A0A4Q9GYX7_9MICO|nr:ATP-binding cassette domain-containing protein [Glaciihabitans arcticus]